MTHRREADAAIDMVSRRPSFPKYQGGGTDDAQLNNQPINGSVLQVRIADSEVSDISYDLSGKG